MNTTVELPTTKTIQLEHRGLALFVTLDRPDSRNAMNLTMVNELITTFDCIKSCADIRAVVLRGSAGHFCAGGDIKDISSAHEEWIAGSDSHANARNNPFYKLNRQFGHLLMMVNNAPQVVIAVAEGSVLGGGLGLVCVSDAAIALASAKFGLPESGLGIPPAQIAPFVVARIGITQARRLALLGARFDGNEAQRLGIVHYVCQHQEAIDSQLNTVLQQVNRCAPHANRVTKELMLAVGSKSLETLLVDGATAFSNAVVSQEGIEGAAAFIEKRNPNWVVG